MYVPSTDQKGVCRLVSDLALDSLEGVALHVGNQDSDLRATRIEILLHPDGFVTVLDNGQGLPVEVQTGAQMHPRESNIPWAQAILTNLYVGEVRNGLAIVNALSQQLNLRIFRDGHIWEQEYRAGVPITQLSKTGATDQHGIWVRFAPDSAVFSDAVFDFQALTEELQKLVQSHLGLSIRLTDEREIDQRTGKFMQIEFRS